MEKETFYKICTRCEDCSIVFFINAKHIFYISSYPTKGMALSCWVDENWIDIIQDRGDWDYFYRKIIEHNYNPEDIFTERARKCFEQFIQEVKKIKL